MGVDRGEATRWTGPDGLCVTVVPMAGAHPVVAGAAGASVARDEPYALLVTRGGALVGRGYYPTVAALAEVVDLAELRPR